MSQPIALIIDDEPDICELINITLKRMNVDTVNAYNYQQAIALLQNQNFNFCLSDMRLPDGDGLDIVSFISKNFPNLPVAIITAHGTMDAAILALKKGAFDFISKPIDLQILRDLVLTALKLNQTEAPRTIEPKYNLYGESEPIQVLKAKLEKISRSQAPVYISGPSGAGKELVANLIHQYSPRSDGPFIPVNCGAIPKDLMESEFFGHKKGSFTGATHDKQGLFQAANRGTLFLDEVADLPLAMQVKLLRAIQERAIRPLGATKEITVDVRILSATHQNLLQKVNTNEFRQDLFYRLNVIELKVPSLQERKSDIPLLTNYFLTKIASHSNLNKPEISDEAISTLRQYTFPGNVRELENILERAFTLCDGKIIKKSDLQLPETIKKSSHQPSPPEGVALEEYLDDIEREAILKALEETRWNKTQAAQNLGISFRALRYRLKKLGLDE